jgi:hypothetical protein
VRVVGGVVGAEPVGVAVEVEDDGSVQEPVEHGGGDGGVAEDLAPRSDAPVARQDDGRLEVALGDDLEDRGGGLGGQGQVTQFIDLCRRRHRSMRSGISRSTPPQRRCSSS